LPGEIKELTKPVGYPGQLLLDGEFDSPPSPPNHTILPSGIIVMGIDSWVARFEMLFEKTSIYFTT